MNNKPVVSIKSENLPIIKEVFERVDDERLYIVGSLAIASTHPFIQFNDWTDVDLVAYEALNRLPKPFRPKSKFCASCVVTDGDLKNKEIQILTRAGVPETVFPTFDFTCCEVAILKTGAEFTPVYTRNYQTSCLTAEAKARINHHDNPVRVISRLVKYSKRGIVFTEIKHNGFFSFTNAKSILAFLESFNLGFDKGVENYLWEGRR